MCKPESILILYDLFLGILALEVLLARALKFQLNVFTPYSVTDHILATVKATHPQAHLSVFKKKLAEYISKSFMSDYLIFTFTPSIIALASADLASSDTQDEISSITEYFPDLSVHILDQVSRVKELLRK